ncbi:hypothetical protein OQA88_8900 [Cercophora sp. LCS_1]
MSSDESTPLLRDRSPDHKHPSEDGHKKHSPISRLWSAVHVEYRIFIFYVFYLMECDVYYSKHPPYEGSGDRCARNEIAAGTATDFSILAMTTTLCGTINLFVAGWTVKRFGPRLALMVQTFVPAIRVATQILGVLAGGEAGIIIFQCTQLITVIGGPAGYILVVNIIAGELVQPARRTVVFGMLQGCIMLGQGIGYLSGGIIGDTWGIQKPFEVAFCSFLISVAYIRVAIPYLSPESMSDGKKPEVKGLAGFFAPLRVLAPQKLLLSSGKLSKHYGVLFLCSGVFLGVLATDYAPLLIQMYATAVFQFHQGDNGWLMSGFALMRAMFLLFLFPRIINHGRAWYMKRHPPNSSNWLPRTNTRGDEASPVADLPTHPEQLVAPIGTHAEEEPVAPDPAKEDEGTGFDLFFLRWSLVADGLLTTGAAFATTKWHIYLAAFILPFASGTAPAAKGVMTEMCAFAGLSRTDALNALTLVENIARLSTQGLFGFVFAALAGIGKPYLTFFCNAAIAFLAAAVLIFSRFAPEGSQIADAAVSHLSDDDGNSEIRGA